MSFDKNFLFSGIVCKSEEIEFASLWMISLHRVGVEECTEFVYERYDVPVGDKFLCKISFLFMPSGYLIKPKEQHICYDPSMLANILWIQGRWSDIHWLLG